MRSIWRIPEPSASAKTRRACAYADCYFCRIATPASLPTIYLVLIGIGGIVVAAATLREIEEQARATRDSVKFQEAHLRQWVTLTKWDASHVKGGGWLRVYVEICNPTNFDLTFESAIFRIGPYEHKCYGRHLLVPKEVYTIDFDVQVSNQDNSDWHFSTDGLTYGIRGGIWIVGVLGRKFQPLGGLLNMGEQRTVRFTPESTHEQSAQEHYGDTPTIPS